MKHSLSAIGCVAFACMLAQPAAAWMRGGTTGAAGHLGAGANGREASGTYATTSKPTHQATTPKGGSAEAGHTNSESHGTTTYGTRYAIGSYGWVVAANDGHVVAVGTGSYAYGTHDSGGAAYGGAHHPPTVVTPYYGAGCYDCGGWGGVAVTRTAILPAGYAYRPIGGNAYYFHDGMWFRPYDRADGMDYRAFPP